jgi:hypothetical protein
MATYSESEFISIYEDPEAKLAQVRLILEALDTAQLALIQKGAIKGYSLNDGQVQISRTYGSLSELNASRLAYEQLANRLIEKIEGRFIRIIPC